MLVIANAFKLMRIGKLDVFSPSQRRRQAADPAVLPLSIGIAAPAICAASSDARIATSVAPSVAVVTRPVRLAAFASRSALCSSRP